MPIEDTEKQSGEASFRRRYPSRLETQPDRGRGTNYASLLLLPIRFYIESLPVGPGNLPVCVHTVPQCGGSSFKIHTAIVLQPLPRSQE